LTNPRPEHPAAPASLPTSEPHIVTEIPPNPSGGGAPAKVEGVNAPVSDELAWLDDIELVELKVEFEKSSDEYGRVTVYQIEVLGEGM
jgi:hypothetical protein